MGPMRDTMDLRNLSGTNKIAFNNLLNTTDNN